MSVTVMLEVLDMPQGCQTSWTRCPYSSSHCCRCNSPCCQKTLIWPGWNGFERNCRWVFSHLSSLGGLERKGTTMTQGLQMSSIPSVDSAIGALDHVRLSTFEYLSHCSGHPLDGACGWLVLEELDLFFQLQGTQIFGSVSPVQTVHSASLAA